MLSLHLLFKTGSALSVPGYVVTLSGSVDALPSSVVTQSVSGVVILFGSVAGFVVTLSGSVTH